MTTEPQKRKHLRWCRQPNETGLARVCQGPRGAELRMGKEILAHVYSIRLDKAWYWAARIKDSFINTANTPVSTMEEAKIAAEKWVREELSK